MPNITVDSYAPQVVRGSQDVEATLFAKVGAHKVRVNIRRDSYDFQSHARIYVWHAPSLKWNLVHSIPYQSMRTPDKLYYRANGMDASNFRADIDTLLATAAQILL